MRIEQLEAAYYELVRTLRELTSTVKSLRAVGNSSAADAADTWRYTLASFTGEAKKLLDVLRGAQGPQVRIRACSLVDKADRTLAKAEEPAYYFVSFRSIRVIAAIREIARDLCRGDEHSLGLYREVRKL